MKNVVSRIPEFCLSHKRKQDMKLVLTVLFLMLVSASPFLYMIVGGT